MYSIHLEPLLSKGLQVTPCKAERKKGGFLPLSRVDSYMLFLCFLSLDNLDFSFIIDMLVTKPAWTGISWATMGTVCPLCHWSTLFSLPLPISLLLHHYNTSRASPSEQDGVWHMWQSTRVVRLVESPMPTSLAGKTLCCWHECGAYWVDPCPQARSWLPSCLRIFLPLSDPTAACHCHSLTWRSFRPQLPPSSLYSRTLGPTFTLAQFMSFLPNGHVVVVLITGCLISSKPHFLFWIVVPSSAADPWVNVWLFAVLSTLMHF